MCVYTLYTSYIYIYSYCIWINTGYIYKYIIIYTVYTYIAYFKVYLSTF